MLKLYIIMCIYACISRLVTVHCASNYSCYLAVKDLLYTPDTSYNILYATCQVGVFFLDILPMC